MNNDHNFDTEAIPYGPDDFDPFSGILMRLVIGPMKYLVVEVNNLTDDNGVQLAGQIDYSALTCEVEKQSPPLIKRFTIWHQIIHILSQQAGISITEEQIAILAYGIMQILRDNPEMRKINQVD